MVGRDDFADYYSRWYVPSNMTVIVVGDTDPALVVDLIRRDFGGGADRAPARRRATWVSRPPRARGPSW